MAKDGKKRVCILFGGRSAEHEVSIKSARNVLKALDPHKYDICAVNISHSGQWRSLSFHGQGITLLEGINGDSMATAISSTSTEVLPRDAIEIIQSVDIFFPVLHGPYGEDGSVQGLMKLLNVPFVGCSVLGSAVTLDKDVTKRLLRDAGIPVCKWLVIQRSQLSSFDGHKVIEQLGLPLFVKPANLGSSVGTSRVTSEEALLPAIRNALRYDHKVLIEEQVIGREIECGVIGNDIPEASAVGEVIPFREFYSYEAKYLDEDGCALDTPAKLSTEQTGAVQSLAINVFKVLGCCGLSRVDFFLTNDGRLIVNEVNSLPGFTDQSMFPRLWEAVGLGQTELIDRLITFAIEKFKIDQELLSEYVPISDNSSTHTIESTKKSPETNQSQNPVAA